MPQPVTQTVGAAGGTIVGPNSLTLDIPSGALEADTQLTIAAAIGAAPLVPLPADIETVGPVYSLTPHGTTFGVPVTLTIPFDAAAFPAGAAPVVLKSNAYGGWQQLAAEVSGSSLIVAVASFSEVRATIGVSQAANPVRIIDEPEDQTGIEGGFAFFRAEARGPSGSQLHYQWFRNGIRLPGETNPEILLPRLRPADDNALYMLRASIGDGTFSADSRAARLLVSPRAPVIVNQPIDAQVVSGTRVTFSAASTSSIPQTLQWARCAPSCTDIDNEAAAVLSFVAHDADDGVDFRFCATNSAATTCSREARLAVIPLPVQPTIEQQPQAVTALAGTSAEFMVRARGGSLTYAWQHGHDGVNFVPHPTCGDAATCTHSNVAFADDGTFLRVEVSNVAG